MNFIKAEMVSSPRKENDFRSAEDIVSFLSPMAKDILEKDGEVQPMLFVIEKKEVKFIKVGDFFESDDTKDIFRIFVTRICSSDSVDGIGLVTEGWLAKLKDRDKYTHASEHPDRVEVLMVYGEWKDCSHKDEITEFGRDDEGKPVLGKSYNFEDPAVGRMRGFFPQRDKSKLH